MGFGFYSLGRGIASCGFEGRGFTVSFLAPFGATPPDGEILKDPQ